MQGFARLTILAAATLATLASAAPAMAQPTDAQKGKIVFMRCMACHATATGAPAKMGPGLAGVVGRTAGQVPGYRYSPAMAQAKITWTPANLDRWLQRPAAMVPGTTMAFAGLPDAAERKAVIAYLGQLKP